MAWYQQTDAAGGDARRDFARRVRRQRLLVVPLGLGLGGLGAAEFASGLKLRSLAGVPPAWVLAAAAAVLLLVGALGLAGWRCPACRRLLPASAPPVCGHCGAVLHDGEGPLAPPLLSALRACRRWFQLAHDGLLWLMIAVLGLLLGAMLGAWLPSLLALAPGWSMACLALGAMLGLGLGLLLARRVFLSGGEEAPRPADATPPDPPRWEDPASAEGADEEAGSWGSESWWKP